MSVLGVGLDLVSIKRVERLLQNKGERALERLLTPKERSYCESQPLVARHVAARLAAKEAAYKAFQGDPEARGIGWRDMEVVRDDSGRPSLRLSGRAAEVAARLNVKTLFLSLTHTDENAAAVVVLSSD